MAEPSRPGSSTPEWETLDLVRLPQPTECFSARIRDRRFAPHSHETFSIGVVESGAIRTHYRGTMLVARVGDVLALNPGEVHTGVPFGSDGVQYHMIYPESALLRRLVGGLGGHQSAVARVKAPIIHDPELAEELLLVLTASSTRRGTTRWARRLATGLRRLWARHADPTASVEAEPSIPPAIQRVRQYIDSHLADHLDIGTLASVATLTPYQLVRQFHDTFGLPPHRFLLDARIRKAKRLIQEDTPLAAVALRTGFCDQSHLTRHFRRVVGVPPGQYARAFE